MQVCSGRVAAPIKKFAGAVINISIVVGILLGARSFGWPLTSDCQPRGKLAYLGAPAQVGTRLQAKIMGVVVAEATVTIAGQYAISIPPDNPKTTVRDGWNPEDEITIWAENRKAQPDFTAFDGTKKIDLAVPAITLHVKRSTWGKIKALFR